MDKNTSRSVVIFVSLIVLTLLIYFQVSHHEFLNMDDDVHISANPHLKEGFSLDALRWAFTADLIYDSKNTDYWQPITIISRLLDVQLFGFNAGKHHLTSVLLHLLSGTFLFLIFKQATKEFWKSAFVAVFFLLHPLQAEAVSWLAARKDILSTFFAVLTIYTYLYYARRRSIVSAVLPNLFFALSVMAKPALITLPLLLFLLDVWPLKRCSIVPFDKFSAKKILFEKFPLFCLAFAFALVFKFAKSGLFSPETWSFDLRYVPVNYVYYLWKIFVPIDLAMRSPFPLPQLPVSFVAAAILVLLIISFFAIKTLKNQPYFFVGWFWFVTALLPAIGLLDADRYTYFPLIGIALAIVWGAEDFASNRRIPKFIFVFSTLTMVCAYSFLSWSQVRLWKNNTTLFKYWVTISPGNARAHNNYGAVLALQGKNEEAIEHFVRALSLKPDFSDAHRNLAVVLKRQGKGEVAKHHCLMAIQMNPTQSPLYVTLGEILIEEGNAKDAAAACLKAIELEADSTAAYRCLGNVAAFDGRFEEAGHYFSEALRINPMFVEAHHDFGFVLTKIGKLKEAALHFQKAVQINPQYIDAFNKLGIVFVMQGRLDEAIHEFETALQINSGDPIAAHNLKLALEQKNKPGLKPTEVKFSL